MTDINTLLKDGDPVQREEELSSHDAQSIRRAMLGAIPDAPEAAPAWRRPLTIAAAAAVFFGVSGLLGHRDPAPVIESADPPRAASDRGSSGETRQLQFATPGGTRIIWVFDQNLRLQESMP